MQSYNVITITLVITNVKIILVLFRKECRRGSDEDGVNSQCWTSGERSLSKVLWCPAMKAVVDQRTNEIVSAPVP